jgi:outer membrane protein assembly factor BamA
VGNRTKIEDKDLYTMRTKEIGIAIKIAPKFYPKHQFGLGLHQDITDFEPFLANGLLSTQSYEGHFGGVSRDLTLSWQYQDNDEDFDPRSGKRISWDVYRSTKPLGSDFENIRFWSNNAIFIPVTERSTLAMQLYGQFSNGDVPWYHLAQSGGNSLLRGYYLGRFRDEQMLVTQAELRRHIFRRFGVVLFASAGQVASTAKELFETTPLVAWGGGVRYRLTRNQRINARLDVGFNRSEPKTPALYLYILEAF